MRSKELKELLKFCKQAPDESMSEYIENLTSMAENKNGFWNSTAQEAGIILLEKLSKKSRTH